MSTFMPSGQKGQQKKVGGEKSALPIFAQFKNDRKGEVAMTFGITAIVMMMAIGAAVDIGRWIHATRQSQQALDAAVLAAAKILQDRGTEAPGAVDLALKTARAFYMENTRQRSNLITHNVEFQLTEDGSGFYGVVDAKIDTSILKVANMLSDSNYNTLAVNARSEAAISVGANAGTNIEVSLMLDTSGSMDDSAGSSSDSKVDVMKRAAKALVNAVVWADQSSFTSRVAIAPFSGDVLLPASWNAAVRGPTPDIALPMTSSVNEVCTGRGRDRVCNWVLQNKTHVMKPTPCIGDRLGDEAYTDETPGPGSYVVTHYEKMSSSFATAPTIPAAPTGTHTTCSQMQTAGNYANAVYPLTNNIGDLESRIDGLITGGGTAGQLGTAWAWYTLSPNFASIMGVDVASYDGENTKKIAVLMTDGEYNRYYDADGRDLSGSTESNERAIALCTAMKLKGIEVYTVGFDLAGNATAAATLGACATDAQHYYMAEDDAALLAAFQDIATRLVELYLRK